jgi:hypothetical protein
MKRPTHSACGGREGFVAPLEDVPDIKSSLGTKPPFSGFFHVHKYSNKTESMRNRFKCGNKAAEKWPAKRALSILNIMLDRLWTSEITGHRNPNPVEANTKKFRKELCLLVRLTDRQWQHIKRKFGNDSSANFNEEVSTIIEKIEDTLECRLMYSGTPMDIMILKTHYNSKNKTFNPETKSFNFTYY